MKTTLLQILWKKELIHWRRVKEMVKKFGWGIIPFGIIAIVLVILAHYAFAVMHTFYELFLFVFSRQSFKENLQRMALKV